jgi:hypothetical protein
MDALRSMRLFLLVAANRMQNRFHPEPATAHAPMPTIVGSPRSGTTLLRLMLDAHRDMAIPPETGFVVPVLRLLGTGARLRRSFFDTVTQYPPEAPAWPDFGLSREALWSELQAIEPFSTSAGLRCFYRMYARRLNKPRWGDKTPRYGLYMQAIEQVLPEAHFIHVIRDGRDVALSLRDLWFSPGKDIQTLAKRWRYDVSTARVQGKRCRHYLELRYEELVLHPSDVLQGVCAFCELGYDPSMETYFSGAPQRLDEHQARVRPDGTVLVTREQRLATQRLTMSPPDPSRVMGWKRAMNRGEREQFERLAGRLLAELGYEVRTG